MYPRMVLETRAALDRSPQSQERPWYKATSWPQARSASGSFSAALPSGKHQPCTAWGRLRFPRASSPQRTPPGGFLHHWSRLGSGNTRKVGYRCSHGILAAITLLNSKRFWTGAPSLEGGISQRLSLNMTELPQFSSSEEEWRSELEVSRKRSCLSWDSPDSRP